MNISVTNLTEISPIRNMYKYIVPIGESSINLSMDHTSIYDNSFVFYINGYYSNIANQIILDNNFSIEIEIEGDLNGEEKTIILDADLQIKNNHILLSDFDLNDLLIKNTNEQFVNYIENNQDLLINNIKFLFVYQEAPSNKLYNKLEVNILKSAYIGDQVEKINTI